MRTDDEGAPLSHLIPTPPDPLREARMEIDLLLKRGMIQQGREARERAAQKLQDDSEALLAAKLRKAQALAERFEWKPVAAVALYSEQTCSNCGSISRMHQGFGVLMKQKASDAVVIKMAACLDRGLPLEKHVLSDSVETCYDCLDDYVAQEEPSHTFTPTKRPEE